MAGGGWQGGESSRMVARRARLTAADELAAAACAVTEGAGTTGDLERLAEAAARYRQAREVDTWG